MQYGVKMFAWVLLIGSILFFHTWRLVDVPVGIYVDETSIGYNAALIAESGKDEHGVAWPVFFEAFGEYKNPLYIYGVAFMFKFFGVSEFTLRLTSTLFFFWFTLALAALIHRQFQNARITFFTVLTAGFIPYFFPLSRIAFEAVSQLATTITWLLLLHMTYVRPVRAINPLYVAFAAGIALGTGVYAYSTGRLLAFVFMLAWIACFTTKKTWQHTLMGVLGFFLALIPYGYFSISHPGALTSRLYIVTYLYDETLSLTQKVSSFIGNYVHHFSPTFLLVDGDTNLRHSSGFGGAVFASTLLLAVVGLAEIVRRKMKDRFAMLVVCIVLISPIAAAITTGDNGHVLRTIPLGIGLLVLVSYGLYALQKTSNWKVLFIFLSLLTVAEASSYLNHYFKKYPEMSIHWFETEGLHSALQTALTRSPQNIIIASSIHEIQTSVSFYRFVLPKLQTATIYYRNPEAVPGACTIYSHDAPIALNTISTAPVYSRTTPLMKIKCFVP